jgi:hypothetical protein
VVARARVVVAAYQQMWCLPRALRGYLRQTTGDFALTVADDGSGPDTAAFVRRFAAEAATRGLAVDHVWHEDRGFRKASILNESVRRSAGEPLLVFADADCVPPAAFVERHLAAHAHRSFHVGGVVSLSEEASRALTEADVDAGRHETLATAADRRDLRRRAWKSRVGLWLRRPNRPKVFGANVAVDRGLFEELNGFDERFEAYGFEDSDLRDRVVRVRPRPTVRVLHGRNDVFHLWHPRPSGRKEASVAYYRSERPVRCEVGLARPLAGAAP